MKNILFIGLTYHDYTNEMVTELTKLGYNVKFYSIKPRSLFYKGLHTVSPALFKKKLDAYHLSIVEKEKDNKYDIVFFLQVHFLELETLETLKDQHSNSIFILYNWDSILTHDYRPHLKYFEKVYTFDPNDAKKLNINYLPLFCISQFQNLKRKNQDQNMVSFVGNIGRMDRYRAIHGFTQYCSKENIKFRKFLKCTPVVFYRLLKEKFFPTDVSFRAISKKEFIDILENSTTVFDFANHKQVGYTMRIIENLCAGKKIITNNQYIENDYFFSDDRILVFKDLDFSGVKLFMERKLADPEKTFPEFHLNNFLKHMLN